MLCNVHHVHLRNYSTPLCLYLPWSTIVVTWKPPSLTKFYLQLKHFWVPRVSTFLLTIVQFLTIALSPSPSDSLNALNTHWGKLSKLSMQCSLVNWWSIQIRLTSKQTVASHCKRQPCNIKKLETTICCNVLFSLETVCSVNVRICKYYTNVFL